MEPIQGQWVKHKERCDRGGGGVHSTYAAQKLGTQVCVGLRTRSGFCCWDQRTLGDHGQAQSGRPPSRRCFSEEGGPAGVGSTPGGQRVSDGVQRGGPGHLRPETRVPHGGATSDQVAGGGPRRRRLCRLRKH